MSKPSFGVILIGLILAVCAVQTVWTQQPVTGTVTLGSGSALAGKVGIDQTTPGTTDSVTVATGQGAGATIGVTTGAKVITDANGTLQQYLRGIIYELITGANVNVLNANANGQGSMANSSPVVIASDQSKLPVKAASGDFAAGSLADGADATLGAKADAKSTATDTTAITIMQVLKEISAMEQAPASRAVTNAGTFPTQSAITAASGSVASGAVASGAFASGSIGSGAIASGAIASGAVASGAYASGAFAAQSFTVGAIPPAAGVLQKGTTAAMTGTTSTQVIAAVASNYIYVTSCSVSNSHASVDTLVNFQDGSGGTTIWTTTAPHGYGGSNISFPTPLKVTTLGNALYVADATTGANVIVSCQGFSSTASY